jgi:hypothetical protein
LKTWPEYFQAVKARTKPFEVRKDDRNFQVGDGLWLREWDPAAKSYTGESVTVWVTYKLADYPALVPGYCVLGIR